MSSETAGKCAHPLCGCLTIEGGKYCSESCEDAAALTEIACQCGHPSCVVEASSARVA